MRKIIALLSSFFLSTLWASPPKLIVQIVVDQLRGDLIHQYQNEFGPAGFNYLLAHGLNFQNTHHPHANTVTCVGHATIATGSYPSLHGIVANSWFDRATQKNTYCVNDSNSPILSTKYTQKMLAGRSPINLNVSTISDEIVLANRGRAFGVSLKDRAAITLAGHAGKAFWFDKKNGGFITSQFYYSAYPTWVENWNNHYQSQAQEQTWELSKPKEKYLFNEVAALQNRFPEFGVNFPHSSGKTNNNLYYKYLSMMPTADELTADFAISLLQKEKLGQTHNQTDYLGISFSVVDAIGHQFGPNSIESEDNLLRLDKTLARLLNAINTQVGLKDTLIVLTADHGITDSPNYLKSHHISSPALLNNKQLSQLLISTLHQQFSLPETVIESIKLPYIYLNHRLINEQNHYSLNQISQALVSRIRQQPGIFEAYSLPSNNVASSWLSDKVNKMAYPNRAGDIYIVSPPYQSKGNQTKMIKHGTPWEYDSFVPLLFVNGNFRAQRILTASYTTDIAATLSALLQIKAPSGSVGRPLTEVITAFEH